MYYKDTSYPQDVQWDATVDAYPVHRILEKTAQNYPEKTGFSFLGQDTSWGEIDQMSRKMAKGFQDQGINKGDHVGLLMPNCPYYIFAYYGLLRIGAIVVQYNPLYTLSEIEALVKESQTKYMVTTDLTVTAEKAVSLSKSGVLEKIFICPFAQCLPFPKSFLFSLLKRKDLYKGIVYSEDCIAYSDLTDNDGAYKNVDIQPYDDIALLQFTGGTTGVPKAAMLSHANLSSNVEQARMWFTTAKEGEEKIAAVLPFFHVFAMTAILNLGTRMAMEIVALPRFELKQALSMIDKKKITFFPAVPAIYTAINNFKKAASYDLSSVKVYVSGGAPLPAKVKEKFETTYGRKVIEGYGLSETSPVACVNPVNGSDKPGSIGLPLPQTQIKLLDLESGEVITDTNQRGEVCIKGPQVMNGYFNRPEETTKVLKDGFLQTGDVAEMDQDGYFFIVDRIKDLIITNGYNVYPRNVEEAIYKHPGVEECIVAGIPDAARGEIVKAWIKAKAGRSLSSTDLKSFLQDKLSPLEMPRVIEFRDEPLPKTMIGKLSKKDILAEEQNKK